MSPDQNQHGSDLFSLIVNHNQISDTQLERQEPANMFFDARCLKAKCTATQTPHTVTWLTTSYSHIMTLLLGPKVKKGKKSCRWHQSLYRLLRGLSLNKGNQFETRFLSTPFAHLCLRPVTGHVDHSVICRDFQPRVLRLQPPSWEKRHYIRIICKLMTSRNLMIGEWK